MLRTKVIKALDGVTATTTSNNFDVSGASRIGILLTRADHSSGDSAFTVKAGFKITEDVGTAPTMVDFNLLIDNVTADAGAGASGVETFYTHVNGKTLNADGSALLWVDPKVHVDFLQIKVTETTDGTHSASIIVQEEA